MDDEQTVTADCEPERKDIEAIKKTMIIKLANTDAHFKHQIRDEPDLSIEEKCEIANELFEKNVGLFLERFSNYLTADDIGCFSDMLKDDYRVNFYINKIKEACAVKSKSVAKNRRYQALQEMMDEGEYFSESQMQSRDPLLYDQMIGQFESEEEKQAKDVDKTDLRFSSILLKYMDKQEMKNHYDIMKEREEEQEEEEDEETEDEEEEDNEGNKTNVKENNGDEEGDRKEAVTEEEKAEMRHEFLRIMQERFLSGEDPQFDYSQVDGNVQYDSLAMLNRDAEEKYFDDEDSNSMTM